MKDINVWVKIWIFFSIRDALEKFEKLAYLDIMKISNSQSIQGKKSEVVVTSQKSKTEVLQGGLKILEGSDGISEVVRILDWKVWSK